MDDLMKMEKEGLVIFMSDFRNKLSTSWLMNLTKLRMKKYSSRFS